MSIRPTMPSLSRRGALGALASVAALGISARARAASPRSGVDLTAMDRAAAPGDDFFRYANGRWFDSYRMKDDEVYAGARSRISDLRRERLRALIDAAAAKDAPAGSLEAQVGALYASYVDIAARDAARLAPLKPDLARIDAVADTAELMRLFGGAAATGLASPLEASLFWDFHEPGRMRVTLAPGGLGLPSREHYLDAKHAETLAAYRAYVAEVLKRAGAPDPGASAAVVVELETRLAKAQWPSSEAYDYLKTANNLSLAELQALTPAFSWQGYLDALGASGLDVLIVRQPTAMAPLAEVIATAPLDAWKAWLRFHLVSDNADYLDEPTEALRFGFYEARLQGQKAARPREARAADLVGRWLGPQLGRLYVERYFPPDAKAKVEAIYDNVRVVLRERIGQAAWMAEPTRRQALLKVDTVRVKIGYPDTWPAFPALAFRKDDLYGNLRLARAAKWADNIAKAKVPLDRAAWQTTPQDNGSSANPGLNEIYIPAGNLEPPFFDRAADPAVNYGAIGGVIAHELGHLFDQLGRKFDATGRLRDWWAPADAARYDAISAKVERQYSAFAPLPGQFLNGKQTLSENTADIMGLGVAFDAWRRSLGGRPSPTIDGLTGEQRVFLGWAQMRAAKETDAFLASQIQGGRHSPDRFRVDGAVRNIDAWYAAFDVRPGQRLYLAPEDRARFW